MPMPPLPIGPFDTVTVLTDLSETYTGTAGADHILGAGGNDLLTGGDGNDYLDGGDGNDRLTAGRGDDTLVGGAGNDLLIGGVGAQQLFGGEGDDRIQSGDRNSTLDGGEGNDTLIVSFSKGATFQMTGGSGADVFAVTAAALDRPGTALLTDFKAGTDTFTVDGVSGATVMNSGVALTLTAGGGFDLVLAGGDTLRFLTGQVQDLHTVYGLAGNDTITGSSGDDRIFAGEGANRVLGGEGRDHIVAGNSADWLEGGAGNDTLNGLRGNDTIHGGDGDDLIHESRGTNQLYGGAGNDRITSGSDASMLDGGSGDDRLLSGAERGGFHSLTGGAGADSFEFVNLVAGRAFGATLTDFNAEEDNLMIGGIDGFLWIAQQGYALLEDETGTTISFGDGSVVLLGLTAEEVEDLVPDLIIS